MFFPPNLKPKISEFPKKCFFFQVWSELGKNEFELGRSWGFSYEALLRDWAGIQSCLAPSCPAPWSALDPAPCSGRLLCRPHRGRCPSCPVAPSCPASPVTAEIRTLYCVQHANPPRLCPMCKLTCQQWHLLICLADPPFNAPPHLGSWVALYKIWSFDSGRPWLPCRADEKQTCPLDTLLLLVSFMWSALASSELVISCKSLLVFPSSSLPSFLTLVTSSSSSSFGYPVPLLFFALMLPFYQWVLLKASFCIHSFPPLLSLWSTIFLLFPLPLSTPSFSALLHHPPLCCHFHTACSSRPLATGYAFIVRTRIPPFLPCPSGCLPPYLLCISVLYQLLR